MAPKRKSSTGAFGAYTHVSNSASAPQKRTAYDWLNRSTSSLGSSYQAMSNEPLRPQLMSPSLENIVIDFDKLTSTFPSSSTGSVISTTPVTPITGNEATFDVDASFEQPRTYLIIGASRGIGLEFAKQLLEANHQVIAVVRNPASASQLWQMTGAFMTRPGACVIEQCDVSIPSEIDAFVARMKLLVERGGSIDHIILNAGILEYDSGLGSLDVEFDTLDKHMRTNCIGNIVLARKLLMLNELEVVQRKRGLHVITQEQNVPLPMIGQQVIFISSDSGSMADFREYEDGFAAYGASKAALNMMIRHMAVELRRRSAKKLQERQADWQLNIKDDDSIPAWEDEVCVLAMHPGEVSTDLANIELGWDVEGVISAEESIRCMLDVLRDKDATYSGTFWRWDGTEHSW